MEFVPPKKVFHKIPQDPVARHEQGSYDIPGFLYPGRSKNGGMVSHFQGHPFPRKGFIYREGVMATNKMKRVTLSLIMPLASLKSGLKGFVESFIYNYTRLIDGLMMDYERPPYLAYEYYSEFPKSIWNFTFLFLRKLGISFLPAYRTGRIIATIFENDDMYKSRALDIFSETTLEKLLNNPRAEIDRLVQIYAKREKFISEEDNEQQAGNRIVRVAKLFKLLLLIPKVKEAFRFALKGIEFKWLQYDESEYYWCLNRADYDCLGKSFEERKEVQIQLMADYAQKMNPGKEIHRIEQDNGNVQIVAI